ncbi:unnamed protein product [Leptidea sinapis]|uniref:Uncharacterized protein n=1 Tax=Leptidea sinapis TaxID=189913 RepID=A0A5E4QKH3_9NEOP|nr:unnamed protein product [Leptidea sinapis]
MELIIKVHLFRSPYTMCYISENKMILSEEQVKSFGLKNACGDKIDENDFKIVPKQKNNFKLNTTAFFLQAFVKECFNSDIYRRNVLCSMSKICGTSTEPMFLKLILEPPDKEVIDYGWNMRIAQLLWTKMEVENAFAWLSTLGGAYSALGDYFAYCADEAARISVKQYKLSKMLGDESLAQRSKLYSAIAFAQKGNLKLARHIVRSVAEFARSTQDIRLNRMCQGVWAKLQYLRQEYQNSDKIVAVLDK